MHRCRYGRGQYRRRLRGTSLGRGAHSASPAPRTANLLATDRCIPIAAQGDSDAPRCPDEKAEAFSRWLQPTIGRWHAFRTFPAHRGAEGSIGSGADGDRDRGDCGRCSLSGTAMPVARGANARFRGMRWSRRNNNGPPLTVKRGEDFTVPPAAQRCKSFDALIRWPVHHAGGNASGVRCLSISAKVIGQARRNTPGADSG